MSSSPVIIFWFRRDLRIDDNHGLAEALKSHSQVLPIFIFDSDILNSLEQDDSRVTFLHGAVEKLAEEFKTHHSQLQVFHGKPLKIFEQLFEKHKVSAVYANEDYEPYAITRDEKIAAVAKRHGAEFRTFKDHVIFGKTDITKDDGTPYKVYTPFAKRWLAKFTTEKLPSYPSAKLLREHSGTGGKPTGAQHPVPSLKELGFWPSPIPVPALRIHHSVITPYADRRNFMALDATTKIGLHLRFGTESVRAAARLAHKHSEVWLKELVWREFFSAILFHFPHTVNEPFDEKFKKFPYRENAADLKRWQEGQTGYPIVDAGMRELNETGFMHNRARMIVGSFLCKHLLLNWKLGERYFAAKLYDFDLSSNVGNWQWVAGCGVDAAPYFRIFSPAAQTKRFDKAQEYIKRWVPEVDSSRYPEPMVDHEAARRRALVAYEKFKTRKI